MLRGIRRFEPIDVPRVIHWSNYSAKAIARVQARGMPIDMYLWNLVQENKALVVAELLRRLDPSQSTPFPIYTPEGEWSYERFEQWLSYVGAHGLAAPRQRPARLDSDAFRLMSGADPRHRGAARPARLARLHPEGQIADRPRRPKSPEPVSVRHGDRTQRAPQEPLQRPRRACGLSCCSIPAVSAFYLDWRSQEVAVAAARFDDRGAARRVRERRRLSRAARSMCGLTSELDPIKWKRPTRRNGTG